MNHTVYHSTTSLSSFISFENIDNISTETFQKNNSFVLPLTICFSVYLLELRRLTASM